MIHQSIIKVCVALTAMCCLNAWGNGTDLTEAAREFLPRASVGNAALVEAMKDAAENSQISAFKEAQERQKELSREMQRIVSEHPGESLSQTDEGRKLFSDYRLETLTKASELRKACMEWEEQGVLVDLLSPFEPEGSFIAWEIGDEKVINEDTKQRISELMSGMVKCCDAIVEQLSGVTDASSAEAKYEELKRLYGGLYQGLQLVYEYYMDDFLGLVMVSDSLREALRSKILKDLIPVEKRVIAARYYGHVRLHELFLLDAINPALDNLTATELGIATEIPGPDDGMEPLSRQTTSSAAQDEDRRIAALIAEMKDLLPRVTACNTAFLALVKDSVLPGNMKEEDIQRVCVWRQMLKQQMIRMAQQYAGPSIACTEEGLKLLSEFRRGALRCAGELRRAYMAMGEEQRTRILASLQPDYGLIMCAIGNDEAKRKDTEMRVRKCLNKIERCADKITKLLASVTDASSAETASGALEYHYMTLSNAFKLSYEYLTDDPESAKTMSADFMKRVLEMKDLFTAEEKVQAAGYFDETYLPQYFLINSLQPLLQQGN